MSKFLVFLVLISIITLCHAENTAKEISEIFRRLEHVESKVNTLEAENEHLRNENVHIKRILKEYILLHDRTDGVRDNNVNFLSSNDHSNHTIFSKENATKEETSTYFRTQFAFKETKRASIIKRLLLDTPTSTTPPMKVAFAAGLSTTINSLGSHQAIEYDEVITNEGNAYDARHGHFIAPMKGMYLISATITAATGKYVALELVKNGQRTAVMFADSRSASHYSSQSRTLPYVLEQGDMVWLRTYPGYSSHELEGSTHSFYNCFAAVLLFLM
ncbi:complement C1q tumor necrosis factor-related protein 6-like [Mytilus trossulus]|uniref:complement C1q tumor necrosis factor-related protein 6-like n=1 Tax=Mytilus trossulus TaxID=6551 RepID=UPI003007BAF5